MGGAHCASALPGTTYRSYLPANLARDVAFYCVWFTVWLGLPLCEIACDRASVRLLCSVYGQGGAHCTIGSWWAGLSVAISYLLVFILSCTMLGRYITRLRKNSLPQKNAPLLFFACDCDRSCYLHAILYQCLPSWGRDYCS